MNISYKLSFIMLFFLIWELCCNSPTQPPQAKNNGILELSLSDVSCTEAWVELKTKNISFPAEVKLLLNDKSHSNLSLSTSDTTIYIDSLLPSKNYQIQTQFTKNSQTVSSNKLAVQTMDTTSNDFSWQTFVFGDPSAGSSELSDVAIIDKNDIWMVGAVYLNDSTGQADPLPYNAANWDGSKWNLKKIAVEYKGNQTIAPLTGILILPDGKIIFSSGLPYLPDSSGGWRLYHLWDMGVLSQNDGSVFKIWGNSFDNLYFVGDKGTIVRYSGNIWQKIESGTTLPINDIWGVQNATSGGSDIRAIASNIYQQQDKKIIKISSGSASFLPDNGLSWSLASTWFANSYKYYIGGDGLYVNNPDNTWRKLNIPAYYIFSIRGTGLNDIVICGGLGFVSHFNGYRWKNYLNDGVPQIQGNYYSSAIKQGVAAAAGADINGYAVAVIGVH